MQSRFAFIFGALIFSLLVSGCGAPGAGNSPSATPAQTSVGPTLEPTPTDSPSETPGESPTETTSSDASPTEGSPTETPSQGGETTDPTGEGSDKPPVLDEGASGRDLTTADFFSTPEEWRDGRFDVAGQKALPGVAGPLSGCDVEADEYTPTIEMRLANNFSKISMKVGQGDDSESSESILSVKLVGNGKYIDTLKVPFNKIDTLSASIENVNALKIQIWAGGDDCKNGNRINAVLMELRVE